MTNPAEQMACYKRAAIGYAYLGDRTGTEIMCREILNVGTQYATQGYRDAKETAVLETNRCYYESAKILASTNPNSGAGALCDQIIDDTKGGNFFSISSSDVTKEKCKREVAKLVQFNPQNYYNTPGNLCALSGFFIIFSVAFVLHTIHKF